METSGRGCDGLKGGTKLASTLRYCYRVVRNEKVLFAMLLLTGKEHCQGGCTEELLDRLAAQVYDGCHIGYHHGGLECTCNVWLAKI